MTTPSTFDEMLTRLEGSASMLYVPADGASDLVIVFSERHAGFKYGWAWSANRSVVSPDFNRLILRDPMGQWFQRGQKGHTGSFRETVAWLQAFADAGGFARVIALGFSAGTHAALLLSAMMKLDAAICLGCRHSIDRSVRMKDTRENSPVRKSLETLWAAPEVDQTLLDANPVLRGAEACRSPVHIHFDPAEHKDAKSHKRLSNLPFVTGFEHPGVGHDMHGLAAKVFEMDPALAGRAKYNAALIPTGIGGTLLAKALGRARAGGTTKGGA